MNKKRITDIWCSETGDIGFTYDGVDLTFKGDSLETFLNELIDENEQLKHLIKQVLETTPIEHTLAMDLKNSIRELYDGDVE